MRGTRRKVTLKFHVRHTLLCFVWAWGFGFVLPPWAGAEIQTTQVVSMEVPVTDNDYVGARQKGVLQAMRVALDKTLESIMGETEYGKNRNALRALRANAKKYVRRYRFLEALDDVGNRVTQMRLEIMFYPDALTRALSELGLIAGVTGDKNLIVLIKEKSLSSLPDRPFWEMVPISETALSQQFIQAGGTVVGRGPVTNMIPEATVMDAAKGTTSAAVTIGLKAGADMVIVGNAISNLVGEDKVAGTRSVQANISVKVFSAHKSILIAAKSDFATAKNADALAAELEAFDLASKSWSNF
ncbi:MAG: hypothetical protein COV67_10100 [Nitrospinae bacterium CG11_big_fil_rev_8_21_14_0_20_56_8]|nr:MAG: hypothetical protein COV67_10100 [Nitrospinae bacterium CG11_big_fil_rev_8_21_14_0_20_56_8]